MKRVVSALTSNPKRLLFAGVSSTIVLAVFMEGIARIVLGGPMKPAMLICQALGLDASYLWLGEILHYALGIVFFPIGYVVFRSITNLGSPVVSGFIWGVILWIGAGVVMSPMAGMPLFFGGGKIMIASLVAHIAYGAVLGGVYGRQGLNNA
ncbi:DUF6789 family protein [Ruegeria sp. SCPT10]|uniref:DUF6789 family protein n=1 Tax=Ruegeria sp. SCP10 TaxID=3141377 RepID=UPI00333CE040